MVIPSTSPCIQGAFVKICALFDHSAYSFSVFSVVLAHSLILLPDNVITDQVYAYSNALSFSFYLFGYPNNDQTFYSTFLKY